MSKRIWLAAIISGIAGVTAYTAGPTFRPDAVFSGSTLTGWTPIGQADWGAQNGEIIGTPRSPDGGWLVLEKSYQDVAFFSNLTCTAGCKAGVLLRAEKTPDGGMKGVFASLTDGDLGNFAVTIDAQGRMARGDLPAPAAARGGGGRGAAAAPAGRAEARGCECLRSTVSHRS